MDNTARISLCLLGPKIKLRIESSEHFSLNLMEQSKYFYKVDDYKLVPFSEGRTNVENLVLGVVLENSDSSAISFDFSGNP